VPITNPSRVEVQDEGATQGLVDQLDFAGAGVTATVSGRKATVTIPGGAGSDPFQGSYAPGSFTIATGKYVVMSKRLELTGTQRVTGQGTARLRVT